MKKACVPLASRPGVLRPGLASRSLPVVRSLKPVDCSSFLAAQRPKELSRGCKPTERFAKPSSSRAAVTGNRILMLPLVEFVSQREHKVRRELAVPSGPKSRSHRYPGLRCAGSRLCLPWADRADLSGRNANRHRSARRAYRLNASSSRGVVVVELKEKGTGLFFVDGLDQTRVV